MIETTFRLTKEGIPYINTTLHEDTFNSLQGDAAAVFFNLFGNEERPVGIGMRVETLYETLDNEVITESEWKALPPEEKEVYTKIVSMVFYPSVPGAEQQENTKAQGSVQFEKAQEQVEESSPQESAGEFPSQSRYKAEQPTDAEQVDMSGLNKTMNLDNRNEGEPQQFKGPTNFLESLSKK